MKPLIDFSNAENILTRTLLQLGQAKSRQDALSIFLQAAIMHSSISRSALTLEFLTREAQEVRISLPPLSPTAADHESSQRGEDSS